MEDARSLYESAITDTDTESAVQLDTENPYAYHTLGVAKAKLDNYTAAIDDFSKAISLKPDFAESLLQSRNCEECCLGKKGRREADLKRAKELDSDIGK